ncbi:MAG: amino acid adenylation domain-containing protein [Heteroscytonema crispum UTEX LB 1556]
MEKNCIHLLFEEQVERTPDALAVVFEDAHRVASRRVEQQLTYQELNHRVNQLAHYLQKLGIGSESLVGICMERSLEIVIGLLAILKAGGAYVPLDPAYPKERIAFIVEETQVAILLTQKHLVNELPQLDSRLVCLDTEWKTIARESEANPDSEVTLQNLAYVIYTSGSTGKPKGVQIPHRNINHYVQAMSKALELQSEDVYLHTASFSFSSSVRQLMIPLSGGATVVMATVEQIQNPLALFELIKRHHVSIIDLVPSYWRSCTEVLANLKSKQRRNLLDNQLRLILSASEPLLSDIPKQWRFEFEQDVRFVNMYGQTETTGIVSVYPIPDEYEDKVTVVPIGRPIANTQIYLLDDDLCPVPVGEIGEMYIGGPSLARDYLKRPDLTDQKFIPNPFSDYPGAYLYKTGDLARYLPDGTIKFVGRVDYQVKIRGKRVELGGIESIITLYPGIKQTVVMGRDDASGHQRLVAYIVPKAFSNEISQTVFTKELRNYLKEKLPEYMVPSAFVVLTAFPLTPTGKIDRRALPAPEHVRQEPEKTFVAPRDELELQLTKIWEQVLGIQPIDVRSNFFDLGGHSLLAVSLFAQIEKKFGKKLPLATLLQSGTVEALAKLLGCEEEKAVGKQVLIAPLGEEKSVAPWSSLVAIQPNGSQPPLFCIHPLGGETLCYRNIALHLGSDQPVYGLQPIGLDGKQPPYTRIEDMASHYIKEIKIIQPNGPYFLVGWSYGGFVVYEMAQQLHRQGEKVGLLGMMDTVRPGYFKRSPLRMRVFLHLKNFLQLGPAYLWQKVVGRIQQGKYHLEQRYKRFFHATSYVSFIAYKIAENDEHLEVISANMQALDAYIFQSYPGRITLLRTKDENRYETVGEQYDPEFGWGDIVEELDIHYIPGSHWSVMEEPHVGVVAAKLQVCLEKAVASQNIKIIGRC